MREVARIHGQPAGKEEDRDTRDESGPLPVPNSVRVVSGCRHHCLRMLIDHLMYGDGELEDLHLERRAGETLAALRMYQTAVGTFLKCVLDSGLPLVGDVEIDGALVAYSKTYFAQQILHHHGSQLRAAVMNRWPSVSQSGSRKLPTFHQCLKEWCQLTPVRTQHQLGKELLHRSPFSNISAWQCSPHLTGDAHSPVRPSGAEKDGSCLTACDIAPMLVGGDRSFRSWSVYQDKGPQ